MGLEAVHLTRKSSWALVPSPMKQRCFLMSRFFSPFPITASLRQSSSVVLSHKQKISTAGMYLSKLVQETNSAGSQKPPVGLPETRSRCRNTAYDVSLSYIGILRMLARSWVCVDILCKVTCPYTIELPGFNSHTLPPKWNKSAKRTTHHFHRVLYKRKVSNRIRLGWRSVKIKTQSCSLVPASIRARHVFNSVPYGRRTRLFCYRNPLRTCNLE